MTGILAFRPLSPADLQALPAVSAEGVALGVSAAEVAVHLLQPDFAWVGWLADRAMGAAGLVPVRRRTLGAWAYLHPDLPREGVWQLLAFARGILDLAHARGNRRIECTVRADNPAGIRFARALRFKPEGIAVAWASDEIDGISFGRVKRSA